MSENRKLLEMNVTMWFDGKSINEALFCEDFLRTRQIIFANGAFFTPDGRVTDDLPLRGEIFEELKYCAVNNIPRKISNIIEIMKLAAHVEDFPPEQDRIHLANGTLMLDGTFTEGKPDIVRNRLPVSYRPDAPKPVLWLSFLDGLLYPEDIPTLQEFIGYCLIPSNKGQRMMVIKGNGGEGKSQIGVVLGQMLGNSMKDGSIGKISENRFARADLEHILLCVDDDMRMEALRQTNYVKSIVTAQGKMDLERKGKQSYQGWMFARLLAFSNGDLQALYDRSDGFYRRQLVLTTKEKPAGRMDDPDLAQKMKAEVEGIFLWAFEGLQRLVANNFKFTESERTKANRESVKRDNNNIFDFMESEGYIRLKADSTISSKDLYEIYRMWCEENNLTPLKKRSFSDAVIANQSKYNLEYCNKITNSAGRRVWGFFGIEAITRPNINGFYDVSERTYVPEGWDD
ncbi:phage/plasmid primase, P4 family [Oscillibacter sp.]|uniref:DNA primase family protein n=1 Tax=Oscillibacter sp. TaxID=1945593 RepID=UPI002579E31A|nr:phage/plasmid primase, P4 family [Oscillibacter sp.]